MRSYIIVLIHYFAFTFASSSGRAPNNVALMGFGRQGEEMIETQRRKSDLGAPVLIQQAQRPNFFFRENSHFNLKEKKNSAGSPKIEFLTHDGHHMPDLRTNVQNRARMGISQDSYPDLQGPSVEHFKENSPSLLPSTTIRNSQQNTMRVDVPPQRMRNPMRNTMRTGLPPHGMENSQQNSMRTEVPHRDIGFHQNSMRTGLPPQRMGNPQQNSMRVGLPPQGMGNPQYNRIRTGLLPQGMDSPQENIIIRGVPPNDIELHQNSMRNLPPQEMGNPHENSMRRGVPPNDIGFHQNGKRNLPPQNMAIKEPQSIGDSQTHSNNQDITNGKIRNFINPGVENSGQGGLNGQANNFHPRFSPMQQRQMINPVHMQRPAMQQFHPIHNRSHRNAMFLQPAIRGSNLPGSRMVGPNFPNPRMMGPNVINPGMMGPNVINPGMMGPNIPNQRMMLARGPPNNLTHS